MILDKMTKWLVMLGTSCSIVIKLANICTSIIVTRDKDRWAFVDCEESDHSFLFWFTLCELTNAKLWCCSVFLETIYIIQRCVKSFYWAHKRQVNWIVFVCGAGTFAQMCSLFVLLFMIWDKDNAWTTWPHTVH